jgi:hypothetical protein
MCLSSVDLVELQSSYLLFFRYGMHFKTDSEPLYLALTRLDWQMDVEGHEEIDKEEVILPHHLQKLILNFQREFI